MDSADILLIILSTVLAIFLILGIVLTVILIGIAKQIKRVAGTAQRTAEYLEGAASSLPKMIGPALITKLVAGLIKKVAKKGK